MNESQFIPFQTTDLTNHKVLVLAPHPDDESLACGGALILHCQNQDLVKVVFLTDGSEADTKREYSKKTYIRLRENEAGEACAILGISDLEFWKIPDRTLSANKEVVSKLARLLEAYRPTLIYAPSPMEFHPDHRATATMLWQAIQKTRLQAKIAFHDYNRPININTLVDITSVIEQKNRACNTYKSQLKYYPHTECATSLNRYRALTVSSFCDYAEGYFLLDTQEIFEKPIGLFALKQIRPEGESKNQDLPLVSIIIRTKDRIPLLRQALSSVVIQTYPNLEVIIINDGGEDVTAVIDEFKSHLNLRYCVHEQSLGRAAAANTGLSMARGKYINFLDDDDLFYDQHVEKLVTFLEQTGEQFAYSDCVAGHYLQVGQGFISLTEKTRFLGLDFDRDWLYLRNYIPIMTAMFTRELWQKVGSLDETLEILEDWDLWIRMAEHTPFHRLPEVTAEYRFFTGHNHDFEQGITKIYQKYQHYWTPENLAGQIWPRIQALQAENLRLKNGPIQKDLRILPYSICSKITRLITRLLPYRLKHWLNIRFFAQVRTSYE